MIVHQTNVTDTTTVYGIMTSLVYRLCYDPVYLMNYGLSLGIKLSFSVVISFNRYRRGFSSTDSTDSKMNINYNNNPNIECRLIGYNNNPIIEWGLIGGSSCPTILE